MTAKEKAKQLVDKYANTNGVYGASKRCALIAVDEIIKANPHSNPFNTEVYSTMAYWNAVRKEIENF